MPGLANPASVYCEKNGGTLDLRSAADGSVQGICVFPDKSECEEWAYYRSDCKPAVIGITSRTTVIPGVENTEIKNINSGEWQVYRSLKPVYHFSYPPDTVIRLNDEPLKSISICPANPGDDWPSITISHPMDNPDFHPAVGTDLPAWLSDHYLLADSRLEDIKIAGETAIHLRHERSPQSFAYDRYYFSHDSQLFMITIGHTSDREDWVMYDKFLASFSFDN